MASSRGTRNPVTRIVAEKHAFVARTTVTCAPGIDFVSAAGTLSTESRARIAATHRSAPADAIVSRPEDFMRGARWQLVTLSSTASHYGNSRTTLNPFAEYRTSASYLNRAAEPTYLAWLSKAPPRSTRIEHCPVVQAEPFCGAPR
jgi:hypothetical protein